jgi:hypothetical protein
MNSLFPTRRATIRNNKGSKYSPWFSTVVLVILLAILQNVPRLPHPLDPLDNDYSGTVHDHSSLHPDVGVEDDDGVEDVGEDDASVDDAGAGDTHSHPVVRHP